MNCCSYPPLAALLFGSAVAAPLSPLPNFDVMRLEVSQTSGLDLDHDDGELTVSQFQLSSLLGRPWTPTANLTILPMAEYEFTRLDLDSDAAGLSSGDEELHSLSLSTILIASQEGSPWLYGGWARAELASDFQHLDGDDFTFDLAAGAGYRFNDCFTLFAGAAVINLNGDTAVYPGIAFDWTPNKQVSVTLLGPSLIASYTVNDDWLLSARGDVAGGVWNITDDAGESRNIDFTSYRLGLFASRRLTGKLWLTAGVGAVVGNEIELTHPDGDHIVSRDADAGLFGSLGVQLKTW